VSFGSRARVSHHLFACAVSGDRHDLLFGITSLSQPRCHVDHVQGAPHHPQTQGKIERWNQMMKNRVLLENYCLPGDLERQIGAFNEHYNNQRYHESLRNLTPADVYHGRSDNILRMRKKIKKQTIQKRRLHHKAAAAQTETEFEPEPPLRKHPGISKNSDNGQLNKNCCLRRCLKMSACQVDRARPAQFSTK